MANFGLFVSSVVGSPVTRWGTGTMIGAHRDPTVEGGVKYSPEHITAIPTEELERYRREYRRALANNELRTRTEAEWNAQNKAEEEAVKAADKAKAERKRKREAEAAKKVEE